MQQKLAGFHGQLIAEAGVLEKEAKQSAPWNDQSAHARQALHAGVGIEKDGYHLYLSHGKEYGSMLETGTGIYGPFNRVIKPVKSKALIIPGFFNPKDPSKPLLVRHIKGMQARPIIMPTIKGHKDNIIGRVLKYWGAK